MHDDGKVIADATETGAVAQIISKVMKDKVEVELNPHQDELDILDFDRSNVEAARTSTVDASLIDSRLAAIEVRRVELQRHVVKAYMVPLQYRDVRLVQTAITEAVLSTRGMGFDTNTQIAMVIKEKQLMTIFLSLRKHDNIGERYYASLDEFVKISDRTLDSLFESYIREFEIGEEEVKK